MKSTRTTVSATALAAMIALAACGSGDNGSEAEGSAQEWRYADYLPPGTGHVRALDSALFDPVEEDGIVSFDKYYQESLLGATDILPGVSDRRADIGFTTNLYHPGELPLTYLGSVPFLADDPEAHVRTFNALYQDNEDFRAEFEAQGVHVISFVPLSGTILASNQAWESPADLRGQSIRAAGFMTTAIESAGGSVVAITAPEIYDAMDRNVIDGFTSYPFGTAISTSLHEVSPYMIDTGAGMYILGMIIVNQSVWDSLDDEGRAAFEDRVDEYVGAGVEAIVAEDEAACETYADSGGTVVVWSEEEKQDFADLVGDGIIESWRDAATTRGVEEQAVDAFYSEYQELYAEFAAGSDVRSGLQVCQ